LNRSLDDWKFCKKEQYSSSFIQIKKNLIIRFFLLPTLNLLLALLIFGDLMFFGAALSRRILPFKGSIGSSLALAISDKLLLLLVATVVFQTIRLLCPVM
jgi:hypothetical protein